MELNEPDVVAAEVRRYVLRDVRLSGSGRPVEDQLWPVAEQVDALLKPLDIHVHGLGQLLRRIGQHCLPLTNLPTGLRRRGCFFLGLQLLKKLELFRHLDDVRLGSVSFRRRQPPADAGQPCSRNEV